MLARVRPAPGAGGAQPGRRPLARLPDGHAAALPRPGLVAAILLVAIYVVEDFGNPALIAGQYTVLPTLAYGLISGFGDFAGAAVVSTILLGLALSMYLVRLRLEGRHGYVTITGRGSSIPRPPVPAAVTWICFALCLTLARLLVLVYGVLVLSAFVEAYPFNFRRRRGTSPTSARTSPRCATAWSTRSARPRSARSFAALLAYIVQRKAWTGRGLVDFIAIVPAAVPGIFFGIGYATAFNQRWLDWMDRGALITISMIFWNIPVGYRAAVAGLQQIDRSIDEAATSMGAGSLRSFRDVLVPILLGRTDHRLRHDVRAGDHDALGGDLPVHAVHDGGDDHDLPARERLQLGRRHRVHGLRHRDGGHRAAGGLGDHRPAREPGRGGRWLRRTFD